ncbi:hypothetical protein LTR66_013370, partial [Elasticomyces elasticus]
MDLRKRQQRGPPGSENGGPQAQSVPSFNAAQISSYEAKTSQAQASSVVSTPVALSSSTTFATTTITPSTVALSDSLPPSTTQSSDTTSPTTPPSSIYSSVSSSVPSAISSSVSAPVSSPVSTPLSSSGVSLASSSVSSIIPANSPNTVSSGNQIGNPVTASSFSTLTSHALPASSHSSWTTSRSSSVPTSASSTSASFGNTSIGQNPLPENAGAQVHSMSKSALVAAVLLPILAIALLSCIFFACLRSRKRRSSLSVPLIHEKKAAEASGAYPPAPGMRTATTQTPILTTTRNPTYFTGLDASEAGSVLSGGAIGAGLIYASRNSEEPPPPYRPRSTAPPALSEASPGQSQNASVRQPSIPENDPFADPPDAAAATTAA